MKRGNSIVIPLLLLAGCTQPERAAGTARVAQLCAEAQPLMPAAGPLAPWIEGVCLVDGAAARIEADPEAVAWFQGVVAKLKSGAS